jgi:hypothetical protein
VPLPGRTEVTFRKSLDRGVRVGAGASQQDWACVVGPDNPVPVTA